MSDQELAENTPSSTPDAQESLVGRSAFLIETVAAGVSVRTVFIGSEDQRVLEMPAVFPDLGYALAQIDDLRRAVMQHFAQAAQVGAQVIAAQTAAADPEAEPAPEEPRNRKGAAKKDAS